MRIGAMNLHAKETLTPSPSPIGWERVAARPGEGRFMESCHLLLHANWGLEPGRPILNLNLNPNLLIVIVIQSGRLRLRLRLRAGEGSWVASTSNLWTRIGTMNPSFPKMPPIEDEGRARGDEEDERDSHVSAFRFPLSAFPLPRFPPSFAVQK